MNNSIVTCILSFITTTLFSQVIVSPPCEVYKMFEKIVPFTLTDCNSFWQLVDSASDEFNGDSIDLSKWSYVPATSIVAPLGQRHAYTLGSPANCNYSEGKDFANGDLAYYTLGKNHEVSNGTFKIHIKRENIIAKVADYDPDSLLYPDQLPNLRPWEFTSGSLVSRMKYKEGKYEIRCRFPTIDGLWPAFWLYGDKEQEIDIYEGGNRNYDEDKNISSKQYHVTTHRNPTEPFQNSLPGEHNNHCDHGLTINTTFDVNDGFHIFSLEWDAYQIIFRVDGHEVYKISSLYDELGHPQYYGCLPFAEFQWNKNLLPDPNIAMEIIIGCGVTNFCSPQNPLFRGSYPAVMEVDYIRYFKRVPEDEVYSCTPLNPDDAIINDNHIHGSNILHILNSITTDPLVRLENDANVWWTAGRSIELLPGFTSEEGSRFLAEIADCEHGFLRTQIGSETDYIIEKSLHIPGDSILLAHPNPVKEGLLYIKCASQNNKFDILKGYDLTGREVFQLKNVDCNSLTLDLSALEKGVYIFRFFNGSQEATRKILIE